MAGRKKRHVFLSSVDLREQLNLKLLDLLDLPQTGSNMSGNCRPSSDAQDVKCNVVGATDVVHW